MLLNTSDSSVIREAVKNGTSVEKTTHVSETLSISTTSNFEDYGAQLQLDGHCRCHFQDASMAPKIEADNYQHVVLDTQYPDGKLRDQ